MPKPELGGIFLSPASGKLAIVRRVFRWKFSSVVIPVLFSLWFGMAMQDKYVGAYWLIVVTFIWWMCYWFTSDYLYEKLPQKPRKPHQVPAYLSAKKRFEYVRIGGTFLIALVCSGSTWITRVWEIEHQLKSYQGRLVPASDPTPVNNCGSIPNDSVMLVFGNNATVTKRFPHTVLSISDVPAIVIDRDSDGALAVVMEVRSRDSRIVVRMEKDRFIVNQNNALEIKRPDRSTLSVTDQEGINVLKARYANTKTIVIDGLVSIPGYGTVPLQLKNFSSNCFYNGIGAADITIKTR